MKKIFLLLLLSSSLLPLMAEPFALDERQSYHQLTQRIINKEKIYFYVNDKTMHSHVVQAFTAWFDNALKRLEVSALQKEQAAPLMTYLQHGANPDTYQRVSSKEEPDFYIHYKSSVHGYCPRMTAGCIKNGNYLYLIYPGAFNQDNYVLKHEIGHAFGLEDLYDRQYPSNGPKYGSGKRESIMNEDFAFSCDDADGIINSLYWALKRKNPQMQDFTFTSLCYQGGTFRNAYLQNRRPQYVDFRGTRTLYTYCTDGTPHSIVQINPLDPQNLYTLIQAPKACEYVKLNGEITDEEIIYPQNIKTQAPYQEILPDAKEWNKKNVLYQLTAQSGQMFLQAVSGLPEIAGYLFLYDENNRPVYLFAYLEKGYNLAYNFYLEGMDWHPRDVFADIFIYDRQDPSLFYVEGGECNASAQKCAEMKQLMTRHTAFFTREYQFPTALPGWWVFHSQKNIDIAQKWEKFLLENFPPLQLVRQKIEKEFQLTPPPSRPLKNSF